MRVIDQALEKGAYDLMSSTQHLLIAHIQPSQLYISTAKLASVLREIDSHGIENVRPVPVKQLDGELVATDGHTRLFALHLMGRTDAPIEWETEDLDWEAYRICVRWCKKEGIRSAADFVGRVVLDTEYKVVWLDRCKVMQDKLAEERKMRQ